MTRSDVSQDVLRRALEASGVNPRARYSLEDLEKSGAKKATFYILSEVGCYLNMCDDPEDPQYINGNDWVTIAGTALTVLRSHVDHQIANCPPTQRSHWRRLRQNIDKAFKIMGFAGGALRPQSGH